MTLNERAARLAEMLPPRVATETVGGARVIDCGVKVLETAGNSPKAFIEKLKRHGVRDEESEGRSAESLDPLRIPAFPSSSNIDNRDQPVRMSFAVGST